MEEREKGKGKGKFPRSTENDSSCDATDIYI